MGAIPGYELFEQVYESNNCILFRGKRLDDSKPVILSFIDPAVLNEGASVNSGKFYQWRGNRPYSNGLGCHSQVIIDRLVWQ